MGRNGHYEQRELAEVVFGPDFVKSRLGEIFLAIFCCKVWRSIDHTWASWLYKWTSKLILTSILFSCFFLSNNAFNSKRSFEESCQLSSLPFCPPCTYRSLLPKAVTMGVLLCLISPTEIMRAIAERNIDDDRKEIEKPSATNFDKYKAGKMIKRRADSFLQMGLLPSLMGLFMEPKKMILALSMK